MTLSDASLLTISSSQQMILPNSSSSCKFASLHLQAGGHSHGLVDKLNPIAAVKPVIKAIQAAVTLGTGSSLGPEGPSVDIGKAWASGLADILKNSRQNKIALVAAGAAAGLAAGEDPGS